MTGGLAAIKVVGGILPADVITRVTQGDLPGMTANDYHLATGERVSAAAARAWESLLAAYRGFRATGDTSTAQTREKWIQQLLRELDYGRVATTAGGHLTAGSHGDSHEYPISHLWADVPMHLLGWKVDLDFRNPGVPGAARAPQSMLQEFLNRNDDYLWALLSNGRTLRMLRDSSALVGQAYAEFDLETIFDGELYSEFVALFALCHQSRLERLPGDEEQPGGVADRWIERWRNDAIATGTRALTSLRGQVEKALETLGTGFYRHPANTALRESLTSGEITPADYQRALLRIVYRLLFWFVVDDRGLLLSPDADPVAVRRYDRFFSSRRLRQIARRSVGTRHDDLWQQVTLVLDGLGTEAGRSELGLPALGGLFELGLMDVLTDCQLPNTATLGAVQLLSNTTDKANSRRLAVDFQHLGAEELGGIYESLLELHPRLDPGQMAFTLEASAGNERKTSGSYYTPSDLIGLVLDEALDPVLAEAATSSDPETALLAVTVCDPACGSGHFLVAAARRIAVRLAAARSGESEPTPVAVQRALRDVVTSCIHGVDLNPMAAELAKVSLWLEAVEPGKPLAFLDANIRVGNALLGATPALLAAGIPSAAFVALTGDDKRVVSRLKKANIAELKQRGGGQMTMDLPLGNAGLAASMASVAVAARGTSLADTHLAATRLREHEDSPTRREAITLADAWCAAFTQPKTSATEQIAVTDGTLQNWSQAGEVTRELVAAEAAQHRFFHWHLEFPRVFSVPDLETADTLHGWRGGFTVMIGNPPWERVKLQEKEFFEAVPEIATAPNAAARKRLIKQLPEADPALWKSWVRTSRASEATSHFLRISGRYPLTGAGDVNTYQVFAETLRDFISPLGRCGFIAPTEIGTGATTAPFIADSLRSGRLATFLDFETGPEIWSGIGHNRFRFVVACLVGVGGAAESAQLAFMLKHPREIVGERSYRLTAQELTSLNPNTGTLPVFRSRKDAEISLGVYQRHPILIRDGYPNGNPWGLSFMRMFDMANDSRLFHTEADLNALGATFDGWAWTYAERRWLPLYESKMLNHFDHRFSTYRDLPAGYQGTALPRLSPAQHDDANCEPLARYWVEESEIETAIGDRTSDPYLLGLRRLTRSTDARTLIPFVLPRTAAGDNMWLGFPAQPVALLSAALSSLVMDYLVRQKLSGTTLSSYIVDQLACPKPDAFDPAPAWLDCPLSLWVVPRALELTYTSNRIAGYARDLGDEGAPFRWIPARREALRAELDAAMMHVYGLDRGEVEHVLDSFAVLCKYEERDHGEFRTKRLVLEIYDAMAEAARTGQTYRTPIYPPPGDGPRHPAS